MMPYTTNAQEIAERRLAALENEGAYKTGYANGQIVQMNRQLDRLEVQSIISIVSLLVILLVLLRNLRRPTK